MKSLKLASASLAGAGVALTVGTAYAHGFGNRYDLPVPLNLFLVGAGATVALSFVVVGFFVQRRSGAFTYPRFNLLRSRWSSTILAGPVSLGAIRTASVAVFLLTVATAMLGSNIPVENLSPTLVWIIWWVGMGYVSALGGNLWMLINPWKITFEWLESLFGGGSKTAGEGMYRYPEGWDVWPALLLFLAFAWTENVYSGASEPFKLGLLILLYSLVTWTGMFVFGKHQWLRHGEAFSVLFGIFARFSPTEVRVADPRVCRTCPGGCKASEGGCVDCYQCFERAAPANREFNLRPIAVGLASRGRVSTPTALFVILALATVTFDGLTATPGWVDFQTATFSAASIFGSNTLEAIDTAGLVMLPVVFVTVYLAFAWAIRHLSREREISVPEIARTFVFSLVPIALAYNLAHFISLLVIQGQFIVPLVSDPFGAGWDLFGTADFTINIAIINAKFVWFVSVAAIVLGHIISVYIAHVISLQCMQSHAAALRSQYPMLLLMVLYTATSLWIIAQPIVAQG